LDEVEGHVGADGRALLEFIALVLRVLAAYAFFALLSLLTYLATGQIASSDDAWEVMIPLPSRTLPTHALPTAPLAHWFAQDPGFLASASLLGSLDHAR
tara:strand:+ start:913 stop:1209 length:297 start_codon:yes stop_codon:yes gene_type:complete